MPYIGRELNRGNYLKLDDISSQFNGSLTTFNLTNGGVAFFPGSSLSILVTLNGVLQEAGRNFSIDQSQITFVNPPASGVFFSCVVLGLAINFNSVPNNSIGGQQLSLPFTYDQFFHLDSTNNRVGIGTLVPASALDVKGTSTFSGPISVANTISFGDGQDLEIYHDGSSYIKSTNAASNLFIDSALGLQLRVNSSEAALAATANGSVELFHNGSKKFETTGIGISVVNGISDIATISGPSNLVIDPVVVGNNTGVVRIKGDLFVDGTTTQINSTTLEISDFVVGIASTATTDFLTDGAGIKIGPDNTFLYKHNGGTNPSLKSSENLNVASGKVYQIGETERLSADTLSLGTGTTIHSPASNTLTLGTNGNERLRITSSGNIGIGENNPSAILHVKKAGDPNVIQQNSGNNSLDRNNTYSFQYSDGQGAFVKATRPSNGSASDTYLAFGAGGSTERLRITSDGDVGIGSASTGGARLRVYKDGNDVLLQQWRGSVGSNTGERPLNLYSPATENTSDYFRFQTGNAIKFQVDTIDALCIASDGDVGIGVTDPTERLTVHGTNNDTTPILGLRSGNGSTTINNGAQIAFGYNGTNHYQHFIQTRHNNSNNNNAIDFYVSDGTQQNTVTSGSVHTLSMVSGKVGIGTTVPTSPLDILLDAGAGDPRIRFNVTQDDPFIELNRWTGVGSNYHGIRSRARGGDLIFEFANNLTTIGNHSYTERLRITSDGKFGFGTNNPQGTVHISSGTDGDATLIIEADSDNSNDFDTPYIVFRQDGGINASAVGHGVDSGSGDANVFTIANSITNGSITFATAAINGYTNATERLRITPGGNIGIGTDDPTERLTVHGTKDDTTPILGLRSGNSQTTTNNGAQIAFGYNGTNHYQHFIQTRHNNSNNNNAIDFYVSDGTQQNTVTSGSVHTLSMVSGKVGIGTNDPVSPIHIVGTNGIKIDDSTNGKRAEFRSKNDIVEINGYDPSNSNAAVPIVLKQYTNERLRITSAGNIGIGITNPDKKLVVRGANGEIVIDDTNGTPVLRLRNNGTTGGTIDLTSSNHLLFRVGGTTERLRINSGGNVGIGTNNPDTLLNLFGTGNTTVKVQNNSATAGTYSRLQLITGGPGSSARSEIRSLRMSAASAATNLVFFTTLAGNTSPTEALRITSAGKVGINSTAPETGLDIRNNDGIFVRTVSNAPTNGARIQFSDQGSGGQRGHIIYKHPDDSISPGSNDGFLIGGSENLSVVKVEGRALIDEKVGIGTDNPVSKLNVAGDAVKIRLSDTDTALSDGELSSAIEFAQNDASDPNSVNASIRAIGDGSIGNLALAFHTGQDNERLRITSGGIIQLSNLSSAYTSGTATRFSLYNDTNNHYGLHVGPSFDLNYNAGGSVASGKGEHVFHTAAAERLRITSAGVVGINTTTGFDTSVGLAVRNGQSGSDHTMIDIIANTNETSRVVFSDDADHNQGRIQYNHNGNSLGFYTNGNNERLHIASGGDVGIGTDNPRTNFQVGAFGSGGDSNIQLATGTSGASNILFGDGSGGTDWYKGFIKYNHSTDNLELYSTDDIIHYTSGTERLRIGSAGQIGLGGTNYGSSGQVLTSNGASSAPTWQDASGGGGTQIVNGTSNVSVAQDGDITMTRAGSLKMTVKANDIRFGSMRLRVSDGGKFEAGDSSDLLMYHNGSNAYFENATGMVLNRIPAGQLFAIQKTGGTENIAIFNADGACEFYHNNSQRILTTTSGIDLKGQTTIKNFNGTGLKLEGSGGNYQGMQLQVTDASASQTRNIFIDAVNESGAAVANQIGSIQSDGGSHWSWQTQPPGNRTDRRVERLRITSTGNVGIGTVGPTKKLDVNGDIKGSNFLGRGTAANNTVFTHGTGTTDPSVSLWGEDHEVYKGHVHLVAKSTNSASDSGQIRFYDYTGTTWNLNMLIDKNGNVGIKQTNPGAFLDIGGNTDGNIQAILTRGADAHFQLQFRNETSSNDAHTVTGKFGLFRNNVDIVGMRFRRGSGTSAGSLDFTTGGVEKVRITSDGNVVIGTTNGLGKLHVRAADECNFVVREETTALVLSAETNSGRDNNRQMSLEGSAYSFTVSGTEKLRIESNGTVNQTAGAFSDNITYGGRDLTVNHDIRSTSMRGGVLVRNMNNFRSETNSASFMVYDAYDTSAKTFAFRVSTGATLSDKFWVKTDGSMYAANTFSGNSISLTSNITQTANAPQHIFKETGSASGNTSWAIVRDSDNISIRWNNAAPYAFSSQTIMGTLQNVQLKGGQLMIDSGNKLDAICVYNFTTSAGANVNVASSGLVRRSTSSAKYKANVETIEDKYSDALLNCRPVYYRSTCEGDNPDYGWWGFIAEEVAEIDPRLVYYKEVDVELDGEGGKTETPCELEPEGVAYDRFVPHLLNLIKRQKQTIETLESKVNGLLGRITALEGG